MQVRKIRSKMLELGYTQQKLAEALGITVQTLNAKLNGRSRLSLDEAISINKILKFDDPVKIFFEDVSQKCNATN